MVAGAAGAVVNTGDVLVLAIALSGPVGAPCLPAAAAADVAQTSHRSEAAISAAAAFAIGLDFAIARGGAALRRKY